ncbi:MAG: ribose-phosphate diphosphokinase [Coriobacteriales bacterium]|jgi:ribose-phosphate pyrophosphokinase
MDVQNRKLMLFAGRSNRELAEGISESIGVELGKVRLETFANGEIYARFLESVRGADVFIVQSVAGNVNDALMELLIMTDAAKRASARKVTGVISHYGYARQDRKSAAREPITAKLVANLLTVAGVDDTIMIDLHQGQIQGFFDTPVNHLTALGLFADYFGKQQLDNLCVVSPDVGRAKAAKKMAQMLNADLAIMHKSRPAHNVAEVSTVIGDVEGKNCILNDDMIDTAGTITNGAKALMEAGAASVRISATHAVFSDPAIERLEECPATEVVVCDTVPIDRSRLSDKFHIISVAPLFGRAILNVYNNGSVSELFDPDFAL